MFSHALVGGFMLDLFYVVVAIVVFAVTWAFTKACDRL